MFSVPVCTTLSVRLYGVAAWPYYRYEKNAAFIGLGELVIRDKAWPGAAPVVVVVAQLVVVVQFSWVLACW